jgi:oligopeptide/dipeptide ABC transporter ATP-binding protein
LIIVTHDLTVIEHMADRIAVMYLGRIVESGPAERLGSFRHPYSQALRAAAPQVDDVRDSIKPPFVLSGDLPDPSSPPHGCRFHTRCPVAQPECATVDPALAPIATSHTVACLLSEAPGGIPSIEATSDADRPLQRSAP